MVAESPLPIKRELPRVKIGDFSILVLRRFVLGLLLCLFSSNGFGACTDFARPGVIWRRCSYNDLLFHNVDLSGAVLRDSTFQRADLTGSNLTDIQGYRVKFIRALLRDVLFDRARLIEADFSHAILINASFRDSDLRFAKFVNADLRYSDFTNARFRRTDLRNANLEGATWIDGIKICAIGSIGQCN